ncbi:hypothetical protein ACWGLP_00360 [Streptomyces lydicus]
MSVKTIMEFWCRKNRMRAAPTAEYFRRIAMIKVYGPYDVILPIRIFFPLTFDSVANGEQLAHEQVSGIPGAGGWDVSPQLRPICPPS